MRFLIRALTGIALTAITAGLLLAAAATLRPDGSDEARGARPGGGERTFTVATETLRNETFSPVISAFGTVEAQRRLDLRASASGTIVTLSPRLRAGNAIEAGEIVAVIDPAEARAARDTARAELAEARSTVEENRAALALAELELSAAQSQRDLRAAALARQRDIRARGLGSEVDLEAAELALSQ
ncbi:MAG: efflux transporter periplasmic adaptor subunit, partial [Rubricella sp.]